MQATTPRSLLHGGTYMYVCTSSRVLHFTYISALRSQLGYQLSGTARLSQPSGHELYAARASTPIGNEGMSCKRPSFTAETLCKPKAPSPQRRSPHISFIRRDMCKPKTTEPSCRCIPSQAESSGWFTGSSMYRPPVSLTHRNDKLLAEARLSTRLESTILALEPKQDVFARHVSWDPGARC